MANRKRRPQGAGSVRQLPSGRWQARYRDSDGGMHPAPVTFDTKLDAGGWLADYVEGVVVAGPQKRDDPTLRAYADLWLAARELKPRTQALYRGLLDGLILPRLGALRISRLTPAKVREWYGTLDPSAPTRRAHAYALLRTIMNTAVSDDLVVANPCRIRGAGYAKTKHRAKVATLAELELIVAAMPPRYRAMVLLAAWCGLRFGELAELRRGDVDLEARLLRISRGVTRTTGNVHIGTPKSEAGQRAVSIPPHLIPLLSDHLVEHVETDSGALVFPAKHGGNMASSALRKVWLTAREAGGRPDLRFHDLRHTGATLAAATGATLADLMSRLGHSTPAAALRYQHAASDRDQAIAEALSGFADAKVIPLRRASR
jgi:integrase